MADAAEFEEVSGKELEREELIRFFSVLSHDLKSPIFSIDGFSELLSSDYADRLDADGKDFLARIRNAAQQMRRVLDEMGHMVKLLSRPNAKRQVDLNEIVEELRLKFNYAIEQGDVRVDVPGELPVVAGDPEKIREAMSALLSNALTFTDKTEGERTITIGHARERELHRICFDDNGVGIDPRYFDQLFDLGLKLDKSIGDGPGYGLYLTRHIIESHGGSISIESEPGKGSRFCFTLPAS
ncbi:MAG TPA: ATP-binding protein [Thermoanaerobaculia bacterium]|nr:ATP-binding protein [Thermoanaerobaculia bacterium]